MKAFIVLGNGFTIDFVNHTKIEKSLDVRNLFSHGTHVKWPPDGKRGFLSYKNCPHLWDLGARPNMEDESAMNLIEEIITCVNVFASARFDNRRTNVSNYIKAYKELLQYLKHLFVHYDSVVDITTLNISDWFWSKFLISLNENPDIEEVVIVTYNYDVWLERVLSTLGIPYSLPIFQDSTTKFQIFKPHGSISFAHKIKNDSQAFSIKYDNELLDGSASDFEITYNNLDHNYLITALIPPAGESGRFDHTWAKEIRQAIIEKARGLNPKDHVAFCGLSYWHVDRPELDELFTALNSGICVNIVNPRVSRTMNAVITSLFKNYILHKSADTLEV